HQPQPPTRPPHPRPRRLHRVAAWNQSSSARENRAPQICASLSRVLTLLGFGRQPFRIVPQDKTESEVLMAVAVEMNFRGATLDQYDQVIEKMGLTPGGSVPPGAISHWVAKTDDGIRVVDVWETREVFDRFAKEQIGPY